MDIQVLSGIPLANIDESAAREMAARGQAAPIGISRKDGDNEVILQKVDFGYGAGTANGLQPRLSIQVQAGYKRLHAFALLTLQRNPADEYELALALSGTEIVNSVNRSLLEANAVTPVQGRYIALNRKIDQSTVEVAIRLQGAAGGGTQLTSDLIGQVVFVLTRY
jgi:hypothetical protein